MPNTHRRDAKGQRFRKDLLIKWISLRFLSSFAVGFAILWTQTFALAMALRISASTVVAESSMRVPGPKTALAPALNK